MSPSWISASTPCLGVGIGRQALSGALTRQVNGKNHLEWYREFPLSDEIFTTAPTAETKDALFAAVRSLMEGAGKSYVSIQVSLPDPAVRFEVFEIDKPLKNKKMTDEFLAWRFSQDASEKETPWVCSSQALGNEQNKFLLLGTALDGRWLACVEEAFRAAGAFPSVIDMGLHHRFNLFHEMFEELQTGSVVIALEPDYWSLGLADGQARLRFARSKWLEKSGYSKDVLESIATDAERTILSYVHSGDNRAFERVFLMASSALAGPMTEVLNKRIQGGCTPLSLDGKWQMDGGLDPANIFLSTLAASLQRSGDRSKAAARS